jgi:hypothetical protein
LDTSISNALPRHGERSEAIQPCGGRRGCLDGFFASLLAMTKTLRSPYPELAEG